MRVMDNAKCHIHKDLKKFYLENIPKLIKNCPYYLLFNEKEYFF